jgi:hypothetical protein
MEEVRGLALALSFAPVITGAHTVRHAYELALVTEQRLVN